MTGAEQRLELADWERGLELEWRAWRSLPEAPDAWSGQNVHDGVGSRGWSPAHLRADWLEGDLAVSWIRRARKGGDSWGAGEPPHETAERYRVKVSGVSGVLRELDVAEPLCVYSASDRAADFPSGGEALFEAAQLGANGEPGAWAALTVEIPA